MARKGLFSSSKQISFLRSKQVLPVAQSATHCSVGSLLSLLARDGGVHMNQSQEVQAEGRGQSAEQPTHKVNIHLQLHSTLQQNT